MNKLTLNARYLRKNMTKEENKLWSIIKNKQFYNYKFLRQYVIGEYIVDFVCRDRKIIIEIDGGQHNLEKNIEKDKKRTDFFENLGYKVIRFWNNDINNNIEGVYTKLQEVFEINQLAPTLTLPQKGGNNPIFGLKDKNLYFIGGVVRDELLDKKSFDIDLTYVGNAINFAKNIDGAEIIRINAPFGTVRIKLDGKEIDIASTRNETYPRKGHLPEIFDIGCSLKDDVLRRDFTINAMAKSTLNGEIVDYTGGLEDLKARKLRVLHDKSFIDDPTRIVRALKFAIRFGFTLEEHTKQLQEEYLANINYDMSYKRLKKELEETFNLNSQKAFEQFINQGIYKLVTPKEYEIPDKLNIEKLINKYNPENIWIIYVGLLPDVTNLPLTKIEQKIIDDYRILCKKNFNSDYEIYKNFESVRIESILMYAYLNEEIVRNYLDNLRNIHINLKGEDLKKLGIKPSAKYKKCFDIILKEKLKNPKMTLEEEIELAKNFFNLE